MPLRLPRTPNCFRGGEETCVMHDFITDLWVIPETNRDMNETPTHFRVPLKFLIPLRWNYYHWPVPNPHLRRRTQRESRAETGAVSRVPGLCSSLIPIQKCFWPQILWVVGIAQPHSFCLYESAKLGSPFFFRCLAVVYRDTGPLRRVSGGYWKNIRNLKWNASPNDQRKDLLW